MNRSPLVLSAIALAALAGCTTEPEVATHVVVTSTPVYVLPPGGTMVLPPLRAAGEGVDAPAAAVPRAGFGHVEAILEGSIAASVTAPNSTRRIVMRMDDGSMQYFETQAEGVAVGDRIEITASGAMRHPV